MSGSDPIGSFPIGAEGDEGELDPNTLYMTSIDSAEAWESPGLVATLDLTSIGSSEAWSTDGWVFQNVYYLPVSIAEN